MTLRKNEFDFYAKNGDFLICNAKSDFVSRQLNHSLVKIESDKAYIYGYAFLKNDIVKNRELSNYELKYLSNNNSISSGVYCVVSYSDGFLSILIDPLVQYNIFYTFLDDCFFISNSLDFLIRLTNRVSLESRHLYDSLAYQSPLRGLTVVKDVYALQLEDFSEKNSNKPLPIFKLNNYIFSRPVNSYYEKASYEELKHLYIENLSERSRIVASKYEEVHIQLTGGADSRLVLSAFLNYDNIFCYCYGDGFSQNRLISEYLIDAFLTKKIKKVEFAGSSLNNSSSIIKGLFDSNFRKFNNLNTYYNGDGLGLENKVKLTGYYGANISGGVALPPGNPKNLNRISTINPGLFDYHDYVKSMQLSHADLRPAAFRDLFYLNNRGPSHYAAHSIAENKSINSLDILYDPINLELVRKFPFDDFFIDKNAITVDLIYLFDKELALFPYDSREIPMWRDFSKIPLINCFKGFDFKERGDIENFEYLRPNVNFKKYDFLKKGTNYASLSQMLGYEEFNEYFEKNDSINYLRKENGAMASILLYFLLASFSLNLN